MNSTYKPKVGDVVVLYGELTSYNGLKEIKNSYLMQNNGIVIYSGSLDNI